LAAVNRETDRGQELELRRLRSSERQKIGARQRRVNRSQLRLRLRRAEESRGSEHQSHRATEVRGSEPQNFRTSEPQRGKQSRRGRRSATYAAGFRRSILRGRGVTSWLL